MLRICGIILVGK